MSSDRQSLKQIAEQFVVWCFVCDERVRVLGDKRHRGHEQHILPEKALREAEARALREAAERIEHTSRPLVTQENVVAWLRQRAEQLMKGQDDADGY